MIDDLYYEKFNCQNKKSIIKDKNIMLKNGFCIN